jgi:uncharacterized protein YdeI (YjbR/CyaY-like superfamily)
MATVAEGKITAVDAYIHEASESGRPILEYLREAVHEGAPGVVEEIKWSKPFFVYKGVILGNMAAFKAYCSFGLWGSDVAGTLQSDGVARSGSMGSFGKIGSVKDLPSRAKLIGYIRLAAKAIDDGSRTKAWSRPKVAKAELEVPEALAAALKKNKAAAKKFEAMTPGCRREYCQWIAEAKREETREKRVLTALEWIAEGKSRNWKYETS